MLAKQGLKFLALWGKKKQKKIDSSPYSRNCHTSGQVHKLLVIYHSGPAIANEMLLS